jgi:hypothetical protein
MVKVMVPVFLSIVPAWAFSGIEAGPFGPSTWLEKYFVVRQKGLIPSVSNSQRGMGVAVEVVCW